MDLLTNFAVAMCIATPSIARTQTLPDSTEVVIHYLSILSPVHGIIIYQDDEMIHLDQGQYGVLKIKQNRISSIKKHGGDITDNILSEAELYRRNHKPPLTARRLLVRIGIAYLAAVAGMIIYVAIFGIDVG